ncbi:MAG: sugar phosphate isomerase/epimerase [Armatimonadetes bacterium]|nr:sugar phosphate isomerase/epimerase [Armatimonadota bacterium]
MARPAHEPGRLPAGLCVFGLTYACGMTWAGTPKANPEPWSGADVLRLVEQHGLSWAELPPRMLGASEPAELQALARQARERGIRFVVPGGRVEEEDLRRHLDIAAALDAPVVRCTLSGILCGDRRGFPGGWRAHLSHCEAILARIVPYAEELGIAVALENHQDADSLDLLSLCERFSSRCLGITLDCGNPLAVMEDPVAFAVRIAPYLRHAHLKDYRVYPAPSGYRLVRCALGAGVVDFPALFRLFDAQEWPITRNIEMGALHCRLIPMLEPSWWDEFPARSAQSTLPALHRVWNALRPAEEEWRTPLERDAPGPELLAYELAQFQESVAYLERHLR